MKTLNYKPVVQKILADTVTPVSIYLRLRTLYPKSILLESSDYHGNENAYSFICFNPVAFFTVDNGEVKKELPGVETEKFNLTKERTLDNELDQFFKTFNVDSDKIELPANGLFGYVNFDAIQHFESIKFSSEKKEEYQIPEVNYAFYKYVVAIDHHKNIIHIVENLLEGEKSQM
ncbi:MAG: anthranilate synthase component I family protein, partial [Draconibacterium sp.]|nr:anthranilate synthase component I family protein [Draconibacterium sp.]